MNNKIKCDSLCVRFQDKECITGRPDEMCDQPDMYREIGDLIDSLMDRADEEFYNSEDEYDDMTRKKKVRLVSKYKEKRYIP